MQTLKQETNTGWSAFPEFRDAQYRMIETALSCDERIVGIEAPTGSGKSLAAMTIAEEESYAHSHNDGPGRVVYAVSTKMLQTQLLRDFEIDGLFEMKGRNNYPCAIDEKLTAETGPCNYGQACDLKKKEASDPGGCEYYDRLYEALTRPLVVTNYAYLLNMLNRSRRGFGKIDVLICDEAHELLNQIQNFAEVSITLSELREQIGWNNFPYVEFFDKDRPETLDESRDEWRQWARRALAPARQRLGNLETDYENTMVPNEKRTIIGRMKKCADFIDRLERVGKMGPEPWACVRGKTNASFKPVWPGEFAEDFLLTYAKKVIMLSATFPETFTDKMNIPKSERRYLSFDSEFPPERNPIYVAPWLSLNYRTPDSAFAGLIEMVDEELEKRDDVKILLPSGSYDRMQKIKEFSAHSDRMITHGRGEFPMALDEYMETDPSEGPILVSPSAVEGIDLHGDHCRCIIYIKFPFPDSRDLVVQARNVMDRDFTFIEAMIKFEQQIGRGFRSADDWCEVIVTDGNWRWIAPKVREMGLGSKFFWDRIKYTNSGIVPLKRKVGL